MRRNYDLTNIQDLNVGNTYTYTLTADDLQYYGFMVTAADTITVSDGTNTLPIALAANEEVKLNGTTVSLAGTLTNKLVFLY